jgi:hypothetical protein
MQTQRQRPQFVTQPDCLTAEDAGTVVGICVGLFIVLAGELTYIICFNLLLRVLHLFIDWRTS